MEGDGGGIFALLFSGVYLVVMLACYVYLAFSLYTIANKTNQSEIAWMSWIPILNLLPMCRIAGKPDWWILLCLIPCVNIVIMVILWMGIAEARNKPNWWGLLMLVPCVNIIVPGYLAFSD